MFFTDIYLLLLLGTDIRNDVEASISLFTFLVALIVMAKILEPVFLDLPIEGMYKDEMLDGKKALVHSSHIRLCHNFSSVGTVEVLAGDAGKSET